MAYPDYVPKNGTTGVVIGKQFVRWEDVPEDYDLTPTLNAVRADQVRLVPYQDGREKAYTLDCCGEKHRIWAFQDGTYLLDDHSLETEEDRQVWKALESLGRDAPMCFQLWNTSPKIVRLRQEFKRFL